MSKLERWLPFLFRRKTAEEKTQQAAAERTSSHQSVPIRTGENSPLALQSNSLSSPINQLMQSFLNDPFLRDPFARFAEMDRWFGDFSPSRFQPTVDVVDEETALRVTAELPGMSKDDIQLQIENDMLVIHGEKRNQEETSEKGLYRSERYYGYFQRAIPLPAELDHDKAEAEFEKGVLTVRLPKTARVEEKASKIPIKG